VILYGWWPDIRQEAARMKTYSLALESGPRQKKTYVHVLDLPGGMGRGDTTEEALDGAPDAIRAYLRFLQRHGEAVDPAEPFETEVVQHVLEGAFLGNGTLTIEADRAPVSAEEAERCARWLGWLNAELQGAVGMIRPQDDPPQAGRSVRAILQHLAGAEGEYLRSTFGVSPEVRALQKQAEQEGASIPDLLGVLGCLCDIGAERIRAMTPEERAFSRQAGQQVWTARKMLRRMLEHRWEHIREIAARVGG
jgi:predicted RNase H-like HicB family nuclease